MNKNRQAVTPILSTVILISMGLVTIVGVSAHYLGISYDNLDCEIQSVQIFGISESVFWGTIQFFNNGEYTIQEYSIIIHDDSQKILIDTIADVDIFPKKSIIREFEITQNLSSDNVIVEILIQNQDSASQCTQEVKI